MIMFWFYFSGLWEKYLVTGDWSQSTDNVQIVSVYFDLSSTALYELEKLRLASLCLFCRLPPVLGPLIVRCRIGFAMRWVRYDCTTWIVVSCPRGQLSVTVQEKCEKVNWSAQHDLNNVEWAIKFQLTNSDILKCLWSNFEIKIEHIITRKPKIVSWATCEKRP